MLYVRLVFWALIVLWQEKTISPKDRLLLWRKAANLFLAFLAFTDRERPEGQLRSAMILGILSATYDYDTDWIPVTDLERSVFLKLLERHVPEGRARAQARELFLADLGGTLSRDGLERGGVTLVVINALIRSRWLSRYSEAEIHGFGRLLQIVDDLLDLAHDREAGDTNCLLTPSRGAFFAEAHKFFTSDFFRALVKNSFVYTVIHFKSLRTLNEEEGRAPGRRDLIRTCRLKDGAFAIGLTLVGFKLLDLPLVLGLPAACAFACMAMNIMVFNDIVDRDRDLKKGKALASEHPWSVVRLWFRLSQAQVALIALQAAFSLRVALFLAFVWLAGLAYSVLRLPYPWNNLLVAVCAGTPLMTPFVWDGRFNGSAALVWAIVFFAILGREGMKDIEDAEGDRGYKETLATLAGSAWATATAMVLFLVSGGLTLLYAHWVVQATSMGVGAMQVSLARSFRRPRELVFARQWSNAFITSLLIALLVI